LEEAPEDIAERVEMMKRTTSVAAYLEKTGRS